jgi:hypothetical protein
MLSNSCWINCGSIDSLTCTRPAGNAARGPPGIGKDFACETAVQYRERYNSIFPRRHAPRKPPTPWCCGLSRGNDQEVANDHVGDVVSEQDDDDDVEAFHTRRAAAYMQMPVCIDSPDGPRLHHLPIVRARRPRELPGARQHPPVPARTSSATCLSSHRAVQLCNETLSDDASQTMLDAKAAIVAAPECRTIECGVECVLYSDMEEEEDHHPPRAGCDSWQKLSLWTIPAVGRWVQTHVRSSLPASSSLSSV